MQRQAMKPYNVMDMPEAARYLRDHLTDQVEVAVAPTEDTPVEGVGQPAAGAPVRPVALEND